jgi:hypothetical protein
MCHCCNRLLSSGLQLMLSSSCHLDQVIWVAAQAAGDCCHLNCMYDISCLRKAACATALLLMLNSNRAHSVMDICTCTDTHNHITHTQSITHTRTNQALSSLVACAPTTCIDTHKRTHNRSITHKPGTGVVSGVRPHHIHRHTTHTHTHTHQALASLVACARTTCIDTHDTHDTHNLSHTQTRHLRR